MAKVITEMTVGVDVSDKHTYFCCVDQAGEVVRQAKVPTTDAGIRKALSKVKAPARVVLEAGTHSPWMSRLIESLGHETIVADPRRLKIISQSATKNDWNDAELLARLGRADLKLLKPIFHRTERAAADLRVLKVRGALVKSRTLLINSVRGLTKSHGARLKACAPERFHVIARESLPKELATGVEPLLKAIEDLTAQIAEQDRSLEAMVAAFPDAQRLDAVYGVGPVTALTFILTLDDKERFKSSRSVGQFVGLCPRQDQSGDSDKQLHISKAGDTQLRSLLVSSAQTILRKNAPDSDLKRWGTSLASRGGKNAKKRAAVAVARKLAVLLHRLWVTGEAYEPLHAGKAA